MLKTQSDRPDKNPSQGNLNPKLIALIESFERLAVIENPVAFHLEFELERKRLKLTQGAFERSWTAWRTQQSQGGLK